MFTTGIARSPLPRTSRRRPRRRAVAVSIVVISMAMMPALMISSSASASGAELSVRGTTASVTGPVSSANARFIEASYQELLGRDPDAAGLDYQLGRIAAGGDQSRHVMAYSLLFSPEGSRQEVNLAYQELLSRSSDAAGETYWTDLLQTMGVIELRVLLLASDEYYLGSGGTNQAWLNALYSNVLGRGLDGIGQTYWLDLLDGGLPRPLVAGAVYQSDEALALRAESYYQSVLKRSASSAERQGAAVVLRARGERYLRAHVWASDEAFEVHLVAAWS